MNNTVQHHANDSAVYMTDLAVHKEWIVLFGNRKQYGSTKIRLCDFAMDEADLQLHKQQLELLRGTNNISEWFTTVYVTLQWTRLIWKCTKSSLGCLATALGAGAFRALADLEEPPEPTQRSADSSSNDGDLFCKGRRNTEVLDCRHVHTEIE